MKKRINIALNNRAGMQDANQGRLDKALAKLSEAVMLAEEIKAPLLVAVSKNNMGIVCQMAGQLNVAKSCFNLARQAVAEATSTDHPLMTIIDRNMARLESEVVAKAA